MKPSVSSATTQTDFFVGIAARIMWHVTQINAYVKLLWTGWCNGQTHSNNLSATADKLLSVFDHFIGLSLTGLRYWKNVCGSCSSVVIVYFEQIFIRWNILLVKLLTINLWKICRLFVFKIWNPCVINF